MPNAGSGARAQRIVVVGATGLVGETMLEVLVDRGHDAVPVHALAAGDGPARSVTARGRAFACTAQRRFACTRGDLLLLGIDAAAARVVAAEALRHGAMVVDNSSAFRDDVAVPLLIPEVNGRDCARAPAVPLIASPNCSTTMLLVALEPLRLAFGVEHVQLATYQALSGAGRAALAELEQGTRAALDGAAPTAGVLPVPSAFNVFPHESGIDAVSGANEEEQKIVAEVRRIWQLPRLPIDPSCVRVPVRRTHGQAVTVTLGTTAVLADVRRVLAAAPGVQLRDGVDVTEWPTALAAAGGDDVLVGRLRHPPSDLDRPPAARRRVSLWLCCDQLRKGAALNAVQIAEHLGWLPAPTGRRR